MQNQFINPVITVVRDQKSPLGKRFTRNPDDSVSKQSAVNLSFGIAVQHHVPDFAALVQLLTDVGGDTHAAIINASFSGIEIGEEFAIVSSAEIEKRLSIPSSDREKQNGIHQITHDGKTLKAVGRFKENVSASNWQLLDRDIDEHTPEPFRTLTTEQWLQKMAAIIPGIDQVTYTETPSTSSRVLLDGNPVGAGNGHAWIFVDCPADIERARAAIMVRAAQAEMTWQKPRLSRKEKGAIVGSSLTTILDQSVWTPGRLVFDGEPTAGDGLTVLPLKPIIHQGVYQTLDTSVIAMPDAKTVREVTRKAGVEMSLSENGHGIRISANDLTLDTEIESKEHGISTVRELLTLDIPPKLRCQSPFRDSDSFAAFFSTNADDIPFVHDSGTGVTHWMNEFEIGEVKIIFASSVLQKLLPQIKEDGAAVLEDSAIQALATIKKDKPAEYNRKRAALKGINPKVPLTDMDRAVKANIAEAASAETHHGYSKAILANLTEDGYPPVGHQGELYVLDPTSCLWEHKPTDTLIRMVAEAHDGKEHCTRRSDYRAIAEHTISLASSDQYFSDGPTGIACPGGFYQIENNEIRLVDLLPDHRQRLMLGFTPTQMPTPMFDAFLHETFASGNDDETAQQIRLLQEVVGGIMLGILHKYQIAVLFYEPFGRAGKGTLEKQIRALVPTEFISAISPFRWHHDYHVATLAGKRLNVVGELPENEAIPASAFKSVIGGDLVTGRHPTHRPITFTNEAAHLFMSNHLITTKDQSEAFFARWKIIEFPNSRLRSGLPLDPGLAQRIIDNEMPGIALWALEGAARLLRNARLSDSMAHDRLMAKWRRSTNTLEEFIHESCEVVPTGIYKRSLFYQDYSAWCSETGRRPFSKGRVKELLECNIGLGITLVERNGYESFKGIEPKQASSCSNVHC